MIAAMVLLFSTFECSSLSSPLGSCNFSAEAGASEFEGQLFRCRLEDSSACDSGKVLRYERGRGKFQGHDYETQSGGLCLPAPGGSIMRHAGKSVWKGPKIRPISVDFEVSIATLTENSVTGRIRAEISHIVALRD